MQKAGLDSDMNINRQRKYKNISNFLRIDELKPDKYMETRPAFLS